MRGVLAVAVSAAMLIGVGIGLAQPKSRAASGTPRLVEMDWTWGATPQGERCSIIAALGRDSVTLAVGNWSILGTEESGGTLTIQGPAIASMQARPLRAFVDPAARPEPRSLAGTRLPSGAWQFLLSDGAAMDSMQTILQRGGSVIVFSGAFDPSRTLTYKLSPLSDNSALMLSECLRGTLR